MVILFANPTGILRIRERVTTRDPDRVDDCPQSTGKVHYSSRDVLASSCDPKRRGKGCPQRSHEDVELLRSREHILCLQAWNGG